MKRFVVLSLFLSFAVVIISACASRASKLKVTKSDFAKCHGWQQIEFEASGQKRRLLYKGPQGAWENGAILVLHGGGGRPEDFCDDSSQLLAPQVRFTDLAIEQKFAVFVLDSTDIVTDNEGKTCGKVWDDEVRERKNMDLPYLNQILQEVTPGKRPAGSNVAMFMLGHSSGGYMTVRAASHMGHLLNAFSVISSGDPYGWARKCDRKYGDKRETVNGAGFDNETGREIIQANSCLSQTNTNEKQWDQYEGRKPKFRIFHNQFDGINDISCGNKIEKNLQKNGFTGEPTYHAQKQDGRRRLIYHFWANEYNTEILGFFKRNLSR